MRNPPSDITRRRSAFTLMELLIVIGIILVLVGILVPVAAQVKKAAQNANTRQMIARIEAGVQAYYSDFQSYPGPFLNAQLIPFNGLTAINTHTPTPANVTSTENLYLALAGGLKITVTSGAVASFNYDETLARNLSGAANLNPVAMKRYQAYISLDVSETTLSVRNEGLPSGIVGKWLNAGTAPFVGDTAVPEIVDKYPRGAPILYIRAARGAGDMYDTLATPAASGNPQYRFAQIFNTYGGTIRRDPTTPLNTAWAPDVELFPAISGTSLAAGTEAYFGNPALSVAADVPSKKDEFILISAGPDGIYGTRDDITNFRSN